MEPGQVVGFFAGIIVIVFAVYFVTCFIGKKASGKSLNRLKNKNIDLIDRFAISKDKDFLLIEVKGKVYLIGITNQTMTLLDTLDAAAFSETAVVQTNEAMFVFCRRYTLLAKRLSGFILKKIRRTSNPNVQARCVSFLDTLKTAREQSSPNDREEDEASQADVPEEKL